MPSKLGEAIYTHGVRTDVSVGASQAKLSVGTYLGTCPGDFRPKADVYATVDALLDPEDLEALIDQLTEAREVLWRNLGRKMEGGGNGLA